MASHFATKALPPPPLRIEKRSTSPYATQPNQLHAAPAHAHTQTAMPNAESSRQAMMPTHSSAANGVARTNSGRFRIRVPSLTKAARPSGSQSADQASSHNSASDPSSSQAATKAWQPRWAPKLKRTTPSESVTTYSPILSPPLPPLPSSATSPPPALQLDDAGFGRPFSTSGLLDMNASRFSFLDMSLRDHDSDSDHEGTASNSPFPPQAPTIREPPAMGQSPLVGFPSSAGASAVPHSEALSSTSGSYRADAGHDLLHVPPLTSPMSAEGSRMTLTSQASLPTSSPALASLISSFPSPTTRQPPSITESLGAHLPPSKLPHPDGAWSLKAPLMSKENSWDGGERWDLEKPKASRVTASRSSTELPYLDMDDEDTEVLASALPNPAGNLPQSVPGPTTVSPPRNRQMRNPPPGPAPTAALPALPGLPSAPAHDDAQRTESAATGEATDQHQDGDFNSRRASRQLQRPLILPTLRSSSSFDRLSNMQQAAGGTSAAQPSMGPSPPRSGGVGADRKVLTLSRNASTDELARSLDIPRDTVRQMLDTTQHVWRNHLLGSSALNMKFEASSPQNHDQLPRSSSSPMLSTLFASHSGSAGGVTRDDGSRVPRSSAGGIPYISSSRPSFEQQSPSWAVVGDAADGQRATLLDARAERAKHRRTFLGRSSEDGLTANYNFSRPIRRDATGSDQGLGSSASMPSLAAARQAPKPPALLQSPLLLKGESEATGFAQFAVDDEEEVLADSASEAHQLSSAGHALHTEEQHGQAASVLTSRSGPFALHKPMPALPGQPMPTSPRLVRRNSDTVLNRFAPEFGKRAPGELHAWSVCIDDDGIPAIRPSASAFHRPQCALAGKTNATWQCGCRASHGADLAATPSSQLSRFATPALTVLGQSSPGRNRSLSASSVMDPARQAQLWSQVERNKELIRKHEQEIAGLQEQVVRISTEISSARPSFSSTLRTPELASATMMPSQSSKPVANVVARKPLPQISSSDADGSRPPVPSKVEAAEPFPSMSATAKPGSALASSEGVAGTRTLRGRIASLSKINLAGRDEETRESQSLDLGHSRLRSSSSTSSLNKVFRFPWSRSSEKETAFPQPTPFPLGGRHAQSGSVSLSRDKALPNVHMHSADVHRPLPAPPVSEVPPSKRYPPSSRKYSYDMLHGPTFHSSVGSRHLRGRSGSSKSSSFGTGNSIFSSAESNDTHEPSRFASFPRFGRRWDSISSRGTVPSARNSADVTNLVGATHASTPALSSYGAKPSVATSSDVELPPRRSSLRKSVEAAQTRSPIPIEFLQANDAGMAPISEQSEMGSPASARLDTIAADVEMSPASLAGMSPAGPARMSMSERYRLQGLTVPAPLPLSSTHASSLASPALSSAVEPDSATKVGGLPVSPVSPRSARSPLPVAFSHGSLTVARQASIKH